MDDELVKRTKRLKSIHELMRRKARRVDPITVEALELTRAFARIEDADARRKVIDLAKKLADN